MNGYEKRTQRKKAAILQAARELFFEHGVTNTGIADIAAKAQVSQVTIYNYFQSKDNLLREVMQAYMTQAIASAEELLQLDIPFAEKVELFFQMGAKEQASLSQNFTNSIAWDDPAMQELYRELAASKAVPFLCKFIEMGKEAGAIDRSIPLESIMAYISAFMPILTRPDFLKSSKEYKEGINKLFYYGLLGKKL